jgi:hypothetical protein
MKVRDLQVDRDDLADHIQAMVNAQCECWDAMGDVERLLGVELTLEEFTGYLAFGGMCSADSREQLLESFYEEFGDVTVPDFVDESVGI